MAKPYTSMTDPTCQYCDDGEIVPVLDKNIEERDQPGNKYRRLCVSCERFNRMASGEEWDRHPDALVLPAGEARDAANVVSASLFFDQDEPDNEFDCPVCETHLTGFPDECPDCGAKFEWDQ